MQPLKVPNEAKAQRPWGKVVNFGPPVDAQNVRGLEDCGDLEVQVDYVEPEEGGLAELPRCHSFWCPTDEELDSLRAGLPVHLVVWGSQIPVAVSVGW